MFENINKLNVFILYIIFTCKLCITVSAVLYGNIVKYMLYIKYKYILKRYCLDLLTKKYTRAGPDVLKKNIKTNPGQTYLGTYSVLLKNCTRTGPFEKSTGLQEKIFLDRVGLFEKNTSRLTRKKFIWAQCHTQEHFMGEVSQNINKVTC